MVFKNLLFAFLMVLSLRLISQPLELSYQEAIAKAIKDNISLKQQKNNLNIFQANKAASIAQYTPTISAGGNAVLSTGRVFDQDKGAIVDDTRRNLSANIGANLTLFNGFRRINTLKRANFNMDMQEQTIESREQELIYEVSLNYQQILLDQQILKIREENLKSQQDQLAQIQALLDEGLRPVTDFYQQEALVKEAEVDLIQMENTLRSDIAALTQLLQIDPGAELRVSSPDWKVEELLLLEKDLDKLYQIALMNRPDYKAMQYQTMVAEKDLKIAKSGYYPRLNLFYAYSSSFSSARTMFNEVSQQNEQIPFNDQFFDQNINRIFGLSFSIPIYDGLNTNTQVVASRVQNDNLKLQLQDEKRNIFANVQNSYLNFEAAKKNYQAAQSRLQAAEKSFELQKESYRLGVADFVAVSQANSTYVDAASAIAQAKGELFFSKIILDYFTGTIGQNLIN